MSDLNPSQDKRLTLFFWCFVLIHILIWSFIPGFIRLSLSNDIIQAVTWGHQFQWGYYQNPWLVGLLARIGTVLGGTSGIGIYFVQQLFVLMGLWSIWRLGCLVSNRYYGLIASLMFEGCVYYTVNVQVYNDNYILLGLWPLAALLFYYIIQTGKWRYWLGCSIILALASMAKYNSVFVVAAFALFLLFDAKKRAQYFLSPKLYVALLVYCAIILPNLIWQFQHSFVSFSYVIQHRAEFAQGSWKQHFSNNIHFLIDVLQDFLPAFIVMLTGLTWRRDKNLTAVKSTTISKRNKWLISVTGLGPFILPFVICTIAGLDLKHEWAMPMIGLWGLWLLIMFRPPVSAGSIKRFIGIVIALLILWPIGYVVVSLREHTGTYPGPEIAKLATQVWHQHYKTKLTYVAGSEYVADYVGFYSKDKPSVFPDWNPKLAAWINQQDLKCKGAVFIQDNRHSTVQIIYGKEFPKWVLKKYPRLIVLPAYEIPWYRSKPNQAKVRLLIGLLPPDPKACQDLLN